MGSSREGLFTVDGAAGAEPAWGGRRQTAPKSKIAFAVRVPA